MSNRQKAIDGGKWITISTLISTLFQFIQISILARLLDPATFGLVSVSTLITNFFFIFSNLGFSNSIIHKQESDKRVLSTLYFLSLMLGLLVFIIIRLSLPLIIAYYQEPRLDHVISVSSYYFVYIFFGQTYLFLLQKELRFKSIALIDILSIVLGTIVAITLALYDYREMALVYGGLVQHLIRTIMQISLGIRLFIPKFYFDIKLIRDHLRFGVFNVGEGLLSFVQSNMDNLFIGALLGIKVLGYYTIAYQLAVFPISRLNPIILQVAYPVLAKMKDNDLKLKESYLKILDMVSYLNMPLLAGLFIMADQVVPLLYGEGWETTIGLIKIFIVASLCGCLSHPLFTLALTKGKPNLLFYLNLITFCIKIPLVYGLAKYAGITGVAVAFSLTMLINLILSFAIVYSLIGNFFREFYADLKKTVFFCLIMVGTIIFYRSFISSTNLYSVLVQISLGGLVYVALTLLFKMPFDKLKMLLADFKLFRS